MFGKCFARLTILSLLLCNFVASFIIPTGTQFQHVDSKLSNRFSSSNPIQKSLHYKNKCFSAKKDQSESKLECRFSGNKIGVNIGALLTVYILNKNFLQALPAFAYDSIPDKEVVEALEGTGNSASSAFGYINFEIFDELARKPLKIPFFLLGAYVVFNCKYFN